MVPPTPSFFTEEHAGTFLPVVKPQGYEYITAKRKK
jgi:hypothetical protein